MYDVEAVFSFSGSTKIEYIENSDNFDMIADTLAKNAWDSDDAALRQHCYIFREEKSQIVVALGFYRTSMISSRDEFVIRFIQTGIEKVYYFETEYQLSTEQCIWFTEKYIRAGKSLY